MYLSLLKNKRNAKPVISETDQNRLTTVSNTPFDDDQMQYLALAIRCHHLNRMWSIFQEFEWSMDLSDSELSSFAAGQHLDLI